MIKSALSLFNIDVFIERFSLSAGPFSFSTETHPAGDWEAWGLGLHVVVSPLPLDRR
jgi:hypothetical protein